MEGFLVVEDGFRETLLRVQNFRNLIVDPDVLRLNQESVPQLEQGGIGSRSGLLRQLAGLIEMRREALAVRLARAETEG